MRLSLGMLSLMKVHAKTPRVKVPEMSLAPGFSHLASRYRGAFVVGTGSLLAFEQILRNFAAGDEGEVVKVSATVMSRGAETIELGSAKKVCELRNPKASPIAAITMTAESAQRRAQVQLDGSGPSDRAAVRVFAQSAQPDAVSALAAAVDRECLNARDSLNHWHRLSVDTVFHWIASHAKGIFIGLLVAWLVFAAGALAVAAKQQIARQKAWDDYIRVHGQPPAAPPSPGEQEPLANTAALDGSGPSHGIAKTVVGVLFGIAIASLCVTPIVAYSKLFPRLLLTIGEGDTRRDRLVRTRTYLILTVIVGNIVLPLAKSGAAKFIDQLGRVAVPTPSSGK